jgi:hypothetical protein
MKRAMVGAACALLVASLSGVAQAGLVTNGGFESVDPLLTGWTLGDLTDPRQNFVGSVDLGFPTHTGTQLGTCTTTMVR